MTEHGKSQPRVYSELNDSHTIAHQGDRHTIAAGITMVNIADRFVSPTRNLIPRGASPDDYAGRLPEITQHDQPHVTERMVAHLRGLPVRERPEDNGLDAYRTFVVNADNRGHAALHIVAPAPQPSDQDHYRTFLRRICRLYGERFGDLDNQPDVEQLTVRDALLGIAKRNPGTLSRTGELAIEEGLGGARELDAVLGSLEHEANAPGDEEPEE